MYLEVMPLIILPIIVVNSMTVSHWLKITLPSVRQPTQQIDAVTLRTRSGDEGKTKDFRMSGYEKTGRPTTLKVLVAPVDVGFVSLAPRFVVARIVEI